jgi:hypothetical protein
MPGKFSAQLLAASNRLRTPEGQRIADHLQGA